MERSFKFAPLTSPSRSAIGNSKSNPAALHLMTLGSLLFPTLVTALLWFTSAYEITLSQGLAAWLLLAFPCASYLAWKRRRSSDVPFFAIIAFFYWIYYGVALFWSEHYAQAARARESKQVLSPDLLTLGMWMTVLTVCCIGLGMRTNIGHGWIPKILPVIKLNNTSRNYIDFLLIVGSLFSLAARASDSFGEGGVQLIVSLQDTVPTVAFLILFREYLRGNTRRIDNFFLAIFLLTRFAVGAAGGVVGVLLSVSMGCIIVYMTERRRLPWLAFLFILLFVVFFQPGKAAFRAETWDTRDGLRSSTSQGAIEKIERWSSLSLKTWRGVLEDSSGEARRTLLANLLVRTSLLTSTAHVIDYTPRYVPYQNGATYSYFAALFIPRALWPDKPSSSEANRFYQVAYDLTREEDLDTVSIASGNMTESYINFGWIGVVVVMYGVGLLFNITQRLLLSRSAGLLLNAIGMVWVINFIGIEAQLAGYIGGLFQRTFLVLIIFAPIIRFRRVESRRAGSAQLSRPTVPLA